MCLDLFCSFIFSDYINHMEEVAWGFNKTGVALFTKNDNINSKQLLIF